ncbi:hypothetical protein EJ05DRAFT_97917 [Pseudovirgaria hyperparasitica]|uniref:Cell morphogenesis protein-like protein n=1 Tax=Pseudovirgaria hyperparasitica TaxID=470096 RepID=A0A6A6VZK9_9PEZI|nr:uncharacterized protein EJ05DRAFT_97917 [Pseudovirgaria hyperparasitica]KAF2755319.1 hypothetical protein EJ05DRAFT_97917 [Pseudovirgaria hyperparasitica]
MSASLPSQARQHAGGASHHPELQSVSSVPPVPSIPAHEPVVNRGRALTSSSRNASPRARTPVATSSKAGPSPDSGGIERKPSISYGHHRNTSIVHGIQHSRNTSFVNSPATSPLSPQMIAAAGGGSFSAFDGPTMAIDEARDHHMVTGSIVGQNGTSKHIHQASLPTAEHAPTSHRRPERMLSSRTKRDAHNRSQSRSHPSQDLKTVGEYALHHLFNAFVGQADQKINRCVSEPSKPEPRVELICGPGVDQNFDQLISALGHIARQKPKPLTDTLMFWRKAKAEEVIQAKNDLNRMPRSHTPGFNGLARRNTEPVNGNPDPTSPTNTIALISEQATERQLALIQAERRSTVSIYILCRVLMEIIGQTTLDAITPDMAGRLEDIIFAQLAQADPESLEESPLRHANWVIFGQLLGVMDSINVGSVSRRYLESLNSPSLSVKGTALLIKGMRYLRLDTSSESKWHRSCDFMTALGRFFADAHGQPVKYAYCQLFKELLLPVAARAKLEFNEPKWRAFFEILRPRVSNLISKPKHWHEAYPLQAAMLCTAPADLFASQWLAAALSCQSRLKERASRAISLRSICRLVWTYLYRLGTDSSNTAVKKLDEIIRMVFVPGKRSYLSTEPMIAEPIIQLIRFIGFRHQDYCFRTIIFPLMNADQISSEKYLRVESLEPERMVIGIRAFLAIMGDLEKGEQPPFPTSFDSDPYTGFPEMPSLPNSPRPPVVMPPKSSFVKEERLSRPVILTEFDEIAKESYARFCRILGDIAVMCDVTFGGQAVLDEKFAVPTPKTPMAEAFNFTRRDEYQNSPDFRAGFYDLLHVSVQALPRCLPSQTQFSVVLNLLCTGTAHVRKDIAQSSAQSLKAIARQAHPHHLSYAQLVTLGFARFIFNFDDRYSTMSDGGMLGPAHIENTLKLYVELLEIWIEDIRSKKKKVANASVDDFVASKRGAGLDQTALSHHADEVESHGLFFLCSPARRVRSYAIKVLRLVTEFDTALNFSNTARIILLMEGSPDKVLNVHDEKLSLAERSRLQRGMRKSNSHSTLIELCTSETTYDFTLWFKVFPNLAKMCFELSQITAALTRDIVCGRLIQLQRTIATLADGQRASPYPGFEPGANRSVNRLASTSPELVIEQWKLYLIFACTTMMSIGGPQNTVVLVSQHTRKSSRSSQKSSNKVQTADELFARVLPFLSASNPSIREAAVIGLGSINVQIYRTLLECLAGHVTTCSEEAKLRLAPHQRTMSSPRRSRRTDHLRTEITHVYKLTARFLEEPSIRNDPDILVNLVTYAKDLRLFLNDAEVQAEWEFQKLRTHYCGLMEELFEGINKTADPLSWMPFQARKAAFSLMEDWCGFSPNPSQVRQREDQMRRSVLDRDDLTNKGIATAAMEIEKRNLRTAALSAMAALCGGPLSITTDSKVTLTFDFARILSWIEMIFNDASDRTRATGRKALNNLIIHNADHPRLVSLMIDKCYMATSSKALESYFEVVTQVLFENDTISLPFWKVLSAGLHTLGHENNHLRAKSLRLLRIMEERHGRNSKLQELDISISDKTIAVYKDAQFQASRRLALTHPDLAFHVFSEFSSHFNSLLPDHQRNMVAAMLPWIQTIELQLDPSGGPAVGSYMILSNMFEITVRSGNALHNEIQALWQALATGPHAGNVQLILDFFIFLCLEKREQNFVDYARQIVVYLSSTPAGSKVVEFLLLQINPRAMLFEKKEAMPPPFEITPLPYMADLSAVLPSSSKQYNFTLGMLCLILLVDLVVPPVQIAREHIPLLLEVIIILWDYHIPLVQDQAREMLIHLIHEQVLSKIEDGDEYVDKRPIEDFIEAIRRSDASLIWAYEANNGKSEEDNAHDRIPEGMNYVTNEVVRVFDIKYPGIQEEWGKVTLNWATSCHVRHLACRSIQAFRSILSFLDQGMLADIFARLSNTISDDANELQIFTMEILITIRKIIEYLQKDDLIRYPQLFWTACACLNTVHESEFMESMLMLDKLLDKMDLSDPATVQTLLDAKPEKWEGMFDGLSSLLYKGVRSSVCLDRTLRLLQRLVTLPSNELVGDDSRLAFVIFANLPRFLQVFDAGEIYHTTSLVAEQLATVANTQGHSNLCAILEHFAAQRYRNEHDFLAQAVSALSTAFFPELEFRVLTLLISLLASKLTWVKINTMQLLCMLIPHIDMRRAEIVSKGPDLISPLLRLLQTEYCPNALEVLDLVMDISGTTTPLDKAHMRMSMAGSHTTREFRKEYEKTASLYGIPEETGWSIPMPAVRSLETRANVSAVWATCAPADNSEEAHVITPKIEFRNEESPFSPAFAAESRTATMTSEHHPDDGHMGELVLKLDSLDDFFGDDDDDGGDLTPNIPGHSPVTTFSHSALDVRENIYDQQTLPILHKSLERNASVSSFQSGFADHRGPRDPAIMTPTAFSSTAAALQVGPPAPRPGLHSRSITSPASTLPQRTPPGGGTFLDETEELFSDDETLVARPGGPDKPFFLETMIRPMAAGARSGFNRGIRRLTGGNAEAKERERSKEMVRREAQEMSPQVPKVPDFYLNRDPKSAEM